MKMSDVIHRTDRDTQGHLLRLYSVSTPHYQPPKSSDWIITNPGDALLALEGIVDPKYWESVGDLILEMSQGDKDAVDAARLAQHNAEVDAVVKDRLYPTLPLEGIDTNVAVSGLTITVNINSVIVDDVTNVVADVALTKTVKVCYLYSATLDAFSIVVFEKTDGIYSSLAIGEQIAADLGEWFVVANGTNLVPVV